MVKTEFSSIGLWNQTLGFWYIYIEVVEKFSSFHHTLRFCISSVVSLPGLQCRSNYLFPFWVSVFVTYNQRRWNCPAI